MKSLGPELEAIVRMKPARARSCSRITTSRHQEQEEIWRKNGGEVITMAPEEGETIRRFWFRRRGFAVVRQSKIKDDYEALLAAARKYRQ